MCSTKLRSTTGSSGGSTVSTATATPAQNAYRRQPQDRQVAKPGGRRRAPAR